MTIKINGTNTTAQPSITGADTDTGLVYGTDEVQVVTGGTTRATVDSSGRLLVGTSSSPTAGSGVIAKSVIQGNTSNSAGAGFLSLQRGQAAASIGTNETLGQISFSDRSGFDYAIIKGQTAAAGGTNDYPGKLIFGTAADGASVTTDRMTIDSSGNLIHKFPGKFIMKEGNNNAWSFHSNGHGGSLLFTDESDSTEQIRFQGTGGISFNGDTAAANALDDYEEGTFTPIGNSNFNGISNADGAYVKVGKIVWISFHFNYTSLDNNTGSSAVTGLPFNPGNANPNTGIEATGVCYANNKLVFTYVQDGESHVYFETHNPLKGSASTGADFFRGSLVYST